MLRLGIRWLAPLVVGVAIGFGVAQSLEKPRYRHKISPVEQGVLYRSGQLDREEMLQELRARDIRTVVNLGSQGDWSDDVCREAGVDYLELPVGDCWTLAGAPAPGHEDSPPAAPFDLSPLWDRLDASGDRPVLIHCWGGVHRTGVVTALYRIQRQGWSADDAIAEMDRFGFNSDKPKYADVLRYLRSLEPSRPSAYPQLTRTDADDRRE